MALKKQGQAEWVQTRTNQMLCDLSSGTQYSNGKEPAMDRENHVLPECPVEDINITTAQLHRANDQARGHKRTEDVAELASNQKASGPTYSTENRDLSVNRWTLM